MSNSNDKFDFSLRNPAIAGFFNQASTKSGRKAAPVRELLYLHTHPMVQENFLKEISDIISEGAKKLSLVFNRDLINYVETRTARFGTLVPELDGSRKEEAAEEMLEIMKDLYQRFSKTED